MNPMDTMNSMDAFALCDYPPDALVKPIKRLTPMPYVFFSLALRLLNF
jgi:hypothetical protein